MKKLWQEGKIKDYYTGITDILRVYLQERYHIGAPEMTTDEIMLALKRKDISEDMKKELREILVLSDLVKFAKENPLPNEHEFCFNSSIDFVNETKETTESGKQPQHPVELTQPQQTTTYHMSYFNSIQFAYPWVFWFLLVIPVMVAFYSWKHDTLIF